MLGATIVLSACHTLDQGTAQGGSQEAASAPEDEQRLWVDLVTGDGWRLAEDEEDPHLESRAGRQPCHVTDFGVEYDGVEVSTVFCDYVTLVQPISSNLLIADSIEIILWHSTLVSEAPARGKISLTLEGEQLWSTELNIPSEAQSWTINTKVGKDMSRDATLTFHVRNHGANAYTLLSVRRGRTLSEDLISTE